MNAKESFSVSFLLQPSFLLQHSFLLFSVQPPFFLFFCFSPLSCFCLAPLFLFLFSTHFLVKRLLFASFSTSFLLSSCSPTFFSFLFDVLPYFFSPKHFFSPRHFSALFFLFVVQRLLLFFFSALLFFLSASFSFSCQLPRPKIFSLAASHLFYLSKSLFSSNLE